MVKIHNSSAHSDSTLITEMFKALLPAQILSSATATLSSLINRLVIGNCLPAAALVALGFVTPMIAILGAISSVVAGGARILCGRHMGRGEVKEQDYVFTASIIVLITVGIILTFAAFSFATPLAMLFGAKGVTTAETARYIQGLAIGIIPTIMVPNFMIFLQMGNESNYAFASSIVLAVCSLGFSLFNVKLGGGVFGMGLAASASQLVTLLFLAVKFVINKDLMRFDMKGVTAKMRAEMIVLGSPTALAALLYSVRNIVINSTALNVGGADAVTALAVLNSVCGLFDAFNIGVGAVFLMLSSVFVGEKDELAFDRLLHKGLFIGEILGIGKVIIIIVFGTLIVSLFGVRGEVASMAYELLFWYGVCMPINIITLALVNPYQAFGRIGFVNIFYIFNAVIAPLACCFLLSPLIGVTGIWICYPVAEVLSLVIILGYVIKKNKARPKKLIDFLCIDKDFSKGKIISLSIKNMNDVVNVSEQLIEFCKTNGIDDRRSYICGLCLEEMAGNVVEYGFSEGKRKNYSVELFVCCNDGKLLMRMRNNTSKFDPRTKLTPFDPENPCKNIGIRMVTKLAKDMNYQASFGMNVLSIEL